MTLPADMTPSGEDFLRQGSESRSDTLGARAAYARMERTAAEILTEALERADVANSREWSRNVAPLLVAALRREMAGLPDSAAERQGVGEAARRLVANMSARRDALLSARLWRLRLRSLRSGRPLKEILLELEQRPRLRSILALERDSGRVIAKWRSEGLSVELASNLIAAIKPFSAKEFATAHGEPRMMNFRSSRILLRASSRLIVAAEFSGEPHGEDKARMDRALNGLLKNERNSLDDRDLSRLAADFSMGPPTGLGGARKWVLGATALILAGFATFLFSARVAPWERRLEEAYASAKGAQPQLSGWPLTLSIDRDKRVAVLSGVAPPDADLDALARALAAADPAIKIEQQAARLETAASAAAAEARLSERATALAEQIQDGVGRHDALESRLRTVEKWLTDKQAEADSPAMRLAHLAQSTVILFGDDDDFLDSEIAHRQLAALAAELKESGGSLRVVGYTDSHGVAIKNRSLSKARADAVVDVLLAEGIEAQRLVAVGRADLAPIALENGADRRRNRRVTFELLGTGDRAQ